MDQKDFFKQMVDFSKSAFDNTFNTMVSFQDQIEAIGNKILDQATWMPQEGKKAISEWVKMCKQARDDFKKAVDENYKKVEEFFASSK